MASRAHKVSLSPTRSLSLAHKVSHSPNETTTTCPPTRSLSFHTHTHTPSLDGPERPTDTIAPSPRLCVCVRARVQGLDLLYRKYPLWLPGKLLTEREGDRQLAPHCRLLIVRGKAVSSSL